MATFCPLIKDQCKQEDCIFFGELNQCMIAQYFFAQYLTTVKQAAINRANSTVDKDEDDEIVIPEDIKNSSVDELADECVEFAKKDNQSGEEMQYFDRQFYWDFLKSKDIEEFDLPKELQSKLHKVLTLAEKKWEAERNQEEKERLQKEKLTIPELAEKCTNWARQNNLTRVTQGDLSAFLIENDLAILPETKTMLLSKIKMILKN